MAHAPCRPVAENKKREEDNGIIGRELRNEKEPKWNENGWRK